MIEPSNSVPVAVVIVTGENDFQTIYSHILAAMNKEIPDPNLRK